MEQAQRPYLPGEIAKLALDKFDSLPARCKPRQLPNGFREWTPLSAIILIKHNISPNSSTFKVISLGTGTKSLPVSALPKCQGLILHDCHAEIIALRGFNYWLLCEIEQIVTHDDYESIWLERHVSNATSQDNSNANPGSSFRIQKDVSISMFSTEAPCGDASMELLIDTARASGADTSPWSCSQALSSTKLPVTDGLPPGRGGFADLGALRRKPARADAEISMSMSCTDKLTLKQFTGVLGFPVDMLIERDEQAFLRSMVVHEHQFDAMGYIRAFAKNGRLKEAVEAEVRPHGVEPHFFDIEVLPKMFRRFKYEKIRSTPERNVKGKVTNTSTVWVAGDSGKQNTDIIEVLVNGVKQGYKQFDERVKKGSVLCRYNMVHKALIVDALLQRSDISMGPVGLREGLKYSELKRLSYRRDKKATKSWLLHRLGGWPSVAGDDFCVDFGDTIGNYVPPYLLYVAFLVSLLPPMVPSKVVTTSLLPKLIRCFLSR